MHLRTAFLTLSVLADTAHMVAHSIGKGSRDDFSQKNQATSTSRKIDIVKDEWPLKRHPENKHLHLHDTSAGLHPTFQENHTVTSEPERLPGWLLRELSRLQEKFVSYSAQPGKNLSHIRRRMSPYTRRLRVSITSHIHKLCGRLTRYTDSLERRAVPTPYQKVVQWMGRMMDRSIQRLLPYLERFDVRMTRLIRGPQNVVVQLGREAEIVRTGLQSRAGALRARLNTLVTYNRTLDESVAHFCQSSLGLIESFNAQIDWQLYGIKPQGRPDNSTLTIRSDNIRSDSLGADFSTRLNALLLELRQSLS